MNKLKSVIVLLALLSQAAWGMDINPTLSGTWYNPDQNGHGLSVEVWNKDTTVVYWYVYDPDGNPTFLVVPGENQGNGTSGKAYIQEGMKFGDFNPNDLSQKVWGDVTVTFSDCNTATLEYSSNDPAYGSGTIPMQRLGSIAENKCMEGPMQGNYIAFFFEDGALGVGVATLFENGDMTYLAVAEDEAGVGLGSWQTTSDNDFTFTATMHSVTGGVSEITGSGEFSSNYFRASYTDGGEVIAITDPENFQEKTTYQDIAGDYDIFSFVDLKFVGSVTVDGQGAIAGSADDGCDLSGSFQIPNNEFNQIKLDLELNNCANSGRITGAAQYVHIDGALVVIGADESTGYVWELR